MLRTPTRGHRRTGVRATFVVLALVTAACGSDSNDSAPSGTSSAPPSAEVPTSPETSSSTTETPASSDVSQGATETTTAASGTSTAETAPTSTASESSTASDDLVGSDRGGYFDTPWPSEHADRWRTQAAKGGLPDGVSSDELVATSVELPPFPVLGYTRGDHVYVVGGSPTSMELYTNLIEKNEPDQAGPGGLDFVEERFVGQRATPYVAKIDPETMTAEILELTEGSTLNYIGGLLMHENGSIFAVSQSVLYQIDADSFSIENTLELPLLESDGEDDDKTTYNGIQVSADGQLVLKGIDMTAQAKGESTQGILLLVDPDTLEITVRTDSDDVGTPRLTLAVEDDREVMYHSTGNESNRFIISGDGFELDDSWTATYRPTDEEGTQSASSPVYMGGSDAVAFANNTLPFKVTTPMQMFSQSTTSEGGATLLGQQAFDSSDPQVNWYLVSADPFVSNMVVVRDQYNGFIAGWQLGDDATLTKAWETDEYASSAGSAIGYEQGHLYVDDRRCDSDGESCSLWLVVLDIETGEQLAEVQATGAAPSMSQTFIDTDAVYYIATEADSARGYVTRIAPGP